MIAQAHGCTLGELLKANPYLTQNGRNKDNIYPGEKLRIPESRYSKTINRKTGTAKCTKPDARKPDVISIKLTDQFHLCKPATFEIEICHGTKNISDKEDVQWLLREKTDISDENNIEIKESGEKFIIGCVPFSWKNKNFELAAKFNKKPAELMENLSPGSAEVFDWIEIIIKAENAYPKWS